MARIPFRSRIIADVGISFGDEGKGRLIPEVIEELRETTGHHAPVSVVMKVNGGANSGHTAGGLKLNLIPAGVIEKSVDTLALGAGVVADPRKLWWETRYCEQHGYSILPRLLIDERCMVSDVTHRLLDLAWEDYRVNVLKQEPRGSTGRGITPAYLEEVGQTQVYFTAFRGKKDDFARCMKQRISRAESTIRHVCQVSEATWDSFFDTLTSGELRANQSTLEGGIFDEAEFDFKRFKGDKPYTLNADAVIDTYWEIGTKFADNVKDMREAVLKVLSEERYIIGEFGQAYWLDKRAGFTPNVTASHSFTPEIFQSAQIPLQPVHTMAVCKAYDTKVGTHTFITEMDDEHPLTIKLKKLEFGVSTGRQRMVGWFDAVEKGDALRYGGFDDLMINKLDALSYNGDWQDGNLLICTSYRDKAGNLHYGVPRDESIHKDLEPVYIEMPCWAEDISGVRNFSKLPVNAQRYIAMMVKTIFDVAYRDVKCPEALPNLRYVGVGPNPSQIIKDVPASAELLALLES